MPASDQGANLERYLLIPRVLIFLRRGSRVLLLRGSPTKRLWPNRYNGLGGHVEKGEDPLTAARRELLEEAGLEADPPLGLRLCGTIIVDTGQSPGVGIYVFTGECSRGEAIESDEGSLHWVEMDEVRDLPGVEDLPMVMEAIRSLEAEAPPFSARSFYDDQGRQVLEFTG